VKRIIDIERAAEAERFGALATKSGQKRLNQDRKDPSLRALARVASSFLDIAKVLGADHKRIRMKGVSIELRTTAVEEVLSIRKAVAS
jgi:hypothetical protein